MRTTSCPSPVKRVVKWLPTKPVAPVIANFMILLLVDQVVTDLFPHNNSLRKASAEPWQLIDWRFPEAAREDLAVDVWRSLMRNCDVALDHVASLSFPSGNASLISSTSRSACLRSGRMNGLLARWINLSSR